MILDGQFWIYFQLLSLTPIPTSRFILFSKNAGHEKAYVLISRCFPFFFFFFFFCPFFLCLCARISHPHCFLLCLNCILSYHHLRQNSRICLSLYSAGQNGRWLVEGLFCLPSHLSSVYPFCHSHLICLSPFADSPSREYPLQLMRDFLSSRYHGMAFREHGGGLALVFALFYFFCSLAYMKCH